MNPSSTLVKRWIATAAWLFLSGTAVHAAPDAKLLAAAQKAQPAVVDNIQKMVLIESGSLNADGLKQMADVIETQLRSVGFKVERRKASAGLGADIVIATLKGTGKRKIMLQGHMDTVFPVGVLSSQPYKVDGNRIYGPGVADDKGGLAVIIASLGILAESNWRDYDTLTVLINPDEEVGSIGSGDLIATLAEQHDVVLSFEPTIAKSVAKDEALYLGAAGIGQATLEVKGRASHAGAAPGEGRNALYELAYQMLQTKDIAKDIPGISLNWTVARATGPVNQIAEKAQAIGDVRITQPGAEKQLDAALQAKVASGKLIPDTETTVKLEVGRPAFVGGQKGIAVAQKAQTIYGEIDRPLSLVMTSGGGTDAGFAGRSGKAAVVEAFGPAGFGFHSRNEYVEIDSIVPRIYLVTRLLVELGRQQY